MRAVDLPISLVYNGEVYNASELRRELESRGHSFRGHSDTEVVQRAYIEWGTEAFGRFNGMFALAIWDARTRTLFLARDRFGVKPLYYALSTESLIFGSEIKSILRSGLVEPSVNMQGLSEYMWYGNTLGKTTAFNEVEQLLPGHYLTVEHTGRVEETAYWSLSDVVPRRPRPAEAVARVRELLDAAVHRHLASDVPVGVFLSGGIDSSAITAFASRHYEGRLASYSVGFDFQEEPDELAKARRVAEQFGTQHHELHLRGSDLPATIERLVRAHDVPFADAANIPLLLLCEQLAGDVRVVLQGDGGDEIFAGYRRYAVASAEPFWRALAPVGRLALRGFPHSPTRHRASRFLRAVGEPDPILRQALLLTVEHGDAPPTAFLGPNWRERLEGVDPFDRYRDVIPQFEHLDSVNRSLFRDLSILLSDDFLPKVDRSTMVYGIEVRVPMLDADLADYALGLPGSLKVRRGQKKWVLREALRGIVPDYILDGRKVGFGVPYASWLRGPLAGYAKSVLLDKSAERSGLLDLQAVERALEQHIRGTHNHGFLLWKLLNLSLWFDMYISNNGKQT